MSGTRGHSGPKHLPTLLKQLNGTARADRLNPDEPEVQSLTELPSAPTYMSAMAQREWRRTGGQLIEMTVLTAADLAGLEAYCALYAHWRDAEAHLKKGQVMPGSRSVPVLSPYVRISKDCQKEMKAWMVEFGLTPASRSRIRVKKPAEAKVDTGEDWFNDRKN